MKFLTRMSLTVVAELCGLEEFLLSTSSGTTIGLGEHGECAFAFKELRREFSWDIEESKK